MGTLRETGGCSLRWGRVRNGGTESQSEIGGLSEMDRIGQKLDATESMHPKMYGHKEESGDDPLLGTGRGQMVTLMWQLRRALAAPYHSCI